MRQSYHLSENMGVYRLAFLWALARGYSTAVGVADCVQYALEDYCSYQEP